MELITKPLVDKLSHTSMYQNLMAERKNLKSQISQGYYGQGKLTKVVNRLHQVNRLLNLYAIEIYCLPKGSTVIASDNGEIFG